MKTSSTRATVGTIVLFVIAEGVDRPAIVVNDWGNGKADAVVGGSACNLQIFVDGANDEPILNEDERHGTVRRESVLFDPEMAVGTYHFQ